MTLMRIGKFPWTLAAFAVVGTVHLLPAAAHGQEKEPAAAAEGEPSVWMKKKLDYSRNILAGLASEDFDKIAENAQAMQVMSKFEGFIRSKMPGYRSQLQVFESANQQLVKYAQKDNVDGATLAFTQLTISCVNCHKQLREGKPQPAPDRPR